MGLAMYKNGHEKSRLTRNLNQSAMYFIYHKYFLQIVFSLNNCPVHQIEHLLNSLNTNKNA